MASKSKQWGKPKRWSANARAMWDEHNARYEFNPAETQILRAACDTLTVIDRLTVMLFDQEDWEVVGSAGQKALDPKLVELRMLRGSLATLLDKLKIPNDDAATVSNERATQARAAAQSRWKVAHGAAS